MLADQSLGDWHVSCAAPGSILGPDGLHDGLDWIDSPCPGTAASAWRAAGRWSPDGPEIDFDAYDWWFRTAFTMPGVADGAGGGIVRFGGIATVADVWLDGVHAFHSENMFVSHEVAVSPGAHDLLVVCRSLGTWLARRRPRGAWKTRLVDQQQLRWVRTTLLGRMPTWPPRAAPVGLWRPVEIVGTGAIDPIRVHAIGRLDPGADFGGTIDVTASWAPGHRIVEAGIRACGVESCGTVEVDRDGGCTVSASISVPSPERWWPATHGEPVLHNVVFGLVLDDGGHVTVPAGRVGFRSVTADRSDDGFGLIVNGVAVFARGACWVPIDPVAVATTRDVLERALRQVVDAGMNVVRVTGTMVYEQPEFYELCDGLGVMVWQDLMFANMDHPIDDEAFVATVDAEVREFLGGAAGHPCLAVVCGGSEVEQQASMMGLDPSDVPHRLGREVLASLTAELAPDAVYVDNSPSGGVFPFSVSTGVSHYYGVGAYLRPLKDARRAQVRFASECLAFSNVPSRQSLEPFLDSGDRPGHSPRWKQAVPRDRAAGWDFEDVRDHYVAELFHVDHVRVRWSDPERYLELGRAATAIAIESTLSEWRRPGSQCTGALMFTMRDLALGAGWGLIDSTGRTKSAYNAAARASAPRAVLLTDEGLDGLAAHVHNDAAAPLDGVLVVRLYDAFGMELASVEAEVRLLPHSARTLSVDGLFGGFRDLSYAYRFGPPGVDVVAVHLRSVDGVSPSDAWFLPGGPARPLVTDLGLSAEASRIADGSVELVVRTRQFAYFVSVEVPGHDPDIDWFHIAPGDGRTVRLTPTGTPLAAATIVVRALNSQAVLSVPVP